MSRLCGARTLVGSILASGNLLVTTHTDCHIRLSDLSFLYHLCPKKIATIPHSRSPLFSYCTKHKFHHKNTISYLAYNALEMLLYKGSHNHTMKVWKFSKRWCVDSFTAHEGHVNTVAFNQDDDCVFTCSSDGTVKIWHIVSRQTSRILIINHSEIPSLTGECSRAEPLPEQGLLPVLGVVGRADKFMGE